MRRTSILPPTYVFISLVIMLVLHFLWPIVQIVPLPYALAGVVPLALGIALNLSADGLFHQAGTTVKPGERSTALVTSGPFRWTRNPMYLGFALVLLGVALLLGSLTPFALIPIFALLMDRLFIRREEQSLAAAFGAAWQDYAARTRRWI